MTTTFEAPQNATRQRWRVVEVHAEKFFIQLGTQRLGVFTSKQWAQAQCDEKNARLAESEALA